MKQKEFKRTMQLGLGRCVQTLMQSADKERYRRIVLWGCLHNLSFDTQCEGPRTWYVFKLASLFKDDSYFVQPTIEAFHKCSTNRYWDFSHFLGVLAHFAENESVAAREAIQAKYDELYARLQKRRSEKNGDLTGCFESLCICRTELDGDKAFRKIIDDLEFLFAENPRYDREDFNWFYTRAKDQFVAKAEQIDELLEAAAELVESALPNVKMDPKTADELITFANDTENLYPFPILYFARKASRSEKEKLAEYILSEKDDAKKAWFLKAFAEIIMPFPGPVELLISWSKSENEGLSEASFEALKVVKGMAVHEYGMELLNDPKRKDVSICMLLTNYCEADEEMLLKTLNSMQIDYADTISWHGIVLHIIHLFKHNTGLSKEFLLWIYEHSLCSCCRAEVVHELDKRNWLSCDLICECQNDSNEDIRKFVSGHNHWK